MHPFIAQIMADGHRAEQLSSAERARLVRTARAARRDQPAAGGRSDRWTMSRAGGATVATVRLPAGGPRS